MLFDRQKHLLALLDTLGGNVGGLDFQKLLFLYCQEVEKAAPYEFVPYKFGGFSFTSYADKRRLIEHGLLHNEEHNWALSEKGKAAVTVCQAVRVSLEEFGQRYSHLRGDNLVAEAYRRYPYYAIRSEVTRRVLAKDVETQRAIIKARPKPCLGPIRDFFLLATQSP